MSAPGLGTSTMALSRRSCDAVAPSADGRPAAALGSTITFQPPAARVRSRSVASLGARTEGSASMS